MSKGCCFQIFSDEMEVLELEGHNGTTEKLRGLKKRTTVQNEKIQGLKCNFSKVGDGAIFHG